MESIGHWHWWILAAALIILEVFAPGAFFLWLGIAAVAVGGVVYVYPAMGWEYQLLSFSVLSVISIVVWRKYFRSTLAQILPFHTRRYGSAEPEPAWPAICRPCFHPGRTADRWYRQDTRRWLHLESPRRRLPRRNTHRSHRRGRDYSESRQ